MKAKVSLEESSWGTKSEKESERKRPGLYLKVHIDEAKGRSLGNQSLEENFSILGVS